MPFLSRLSRTGSVMIGLLGCGDVAVAPVSGVARPSAAVAASLPAPQHLLASALSLSQARLSWKDMSGSETGFKILRSTTGSAGQYSAIGTVGSNVTKFTDSKLSRGRQYCYEVRAKAGDVETSAGSNRVCVTTMSGTAPAVRVVTFGDSNTDWGLDGTSPNVLATSYISGSPHSAAMLPHTSDQLADKIETRWRAVRSNAIRAVNHAISGTTTGGGGYGGPNRRWTGAPQARTRAGGVTRFEGEVLGSKWPWSGGEPVNEKYPDGSLRRIQSFVPGTNDFAYISMGTNDPSNGMSTSQTLANLSWMIDRWLAAGKRADHFLLTTLAPRSDKWGGTIPQINEGIRALATSKGAVLIDLASYTSADGGRTWRSSSLHVGDGVHYGEAVRDWLAGRVVDEMLRRVP